MILEPGEENDFYKLQDNINYCRKLQENLLNRKWENVYKERCPKYYLPLNEIIRKIESENLFNVPSILSIGTKLKEFVYHNTCQISSIIDLFKYCKDFHLDIPKCVKNMICEACACNGCEFMQDHLGYTCEDCKKDYYTGYQGYCDE